MTDCTNRTFHGRGQRLADEPGRPRPSDVPSISSTCSAEPFSDSANLDELIPPPDVNTVRDVNYLAIAKKTVQFFVDVGNLAPTDAVLDVGCGAGRMAAPLTQYLRDGGSYEGFDIVPNAIQWCQERITPKHPNFKFRVANIRNRAYQPDGRHKASEYRFPYNDESFDFVIATSVFTHMLDSETDNYLAEISRVVKKGGRCIITYFLLNDESEALMKKGSSHLDFRFNMGICRTTSKETPEQAVAYPESHVQALYARNMLDIVHPLELGRWCGRPERLMYQDFVLAEKRP